MKSPNKDSKLFAILGPTNTGKTYFAFERLLSYQSGIFGFPLRLLARENYDKAINIVGRDKVALITGEEKIMPKDAKYFFCTVESMPSHFSVECIAVDEIQLCADYERGHIFTDKILHSRGYYETLFLGSLTIKKILLKLFPKIIIRTRERFSRLSYSKTQSISKLKPRTAIIGFNVNKVYEIAENLKSHKGGAAVILGSLSPRTRNAQVEVYENSNVDYLVATDAIGMGLNLNIDHVFFSSLKKFDGRYNRNLLPSEIGQIAGRAGRYLNDGTFGLIKGAGNIDPLIINSIEEHNFQKINKIYWRNSHIDFTSSASVVNSLKKNPKEDFFIQKRNAEDEISFKNLCLDNEVSSYLDTPKNIKLLWDVCLIPDFQKIMNDSYLELLKSIYLNLIKHDFLIPENWIQERVSRLENYSGGIDELSRKITSIRTWTYIANQSNWLSNNVYWQEKTKNIEDNLSDQLHESLINRFIDLSASFFVNNKNKGIEPKIDINSDKSINIDGQMYGYFNAFKLKLSDNISSVSNFTHNHVKRTVRSMMIERIDDFLNAPLDSINLGQINDLNFQDDVKMYWGDEPVGFLKKGKYIFSPKVETYDSEFLDTGQKQKISIKLQEWIDNKIMTVLKPIKDNIENEIQSSEIRLITYNLFNFLGTMPVENYFNDIKNLTIENKSIISKLGIRIGAKFFFTPNFLKKQAIQLNAVLWKIFNENDLSGKFPLPNDGRVSFHTDLNMPDTYWQAIGYLCINKFAVRIDVFERIFFIARKKIKLGPFLESSDMMNPIGCNSEQLGNLLYYCGFENIIIANERRLFFYKRNKLKKKIPKIKKIKKIKLKNTKKKTERRKFDPNSPFAVLQKLL